MKCPLCGAKLSVLPGFRFDAEGNCLSVLLSCPSHLCPAQEVIGHGRNHHEAYAIILDKYKPDAQTEERRLALIAKQ